ncbi:MAG: SCO family protein [Alcaligenaceae bacterium]|nr:SCO family protein [Alcaligenaceae bacterium]
MLRKILTKLLVCSLVLFSGTVYAQKITFDLVDPKGQVTHESYPGKYLLLAIGYTSCPDICPTTLYEYGMSMKAIKNPDAIQPLFVTIDPTNDEVNRLNAYTGFFDKRIVGLTGTKENIKDLADQLGATYGYSLNGKRIEDPEPGMSYTVYHSAIIYLISPEREIVDAYDYLIGVEGLTEALDEALGEPEGVVNSQIMASAEAVEPKMTAEATAQTSAVTTQDQALSCALPEGFVATNEAPELAAVVDSAPEAKVSLLNLWAIWCQPCRVELPILDKFAAEQDEMSIIALNLNDKEDKIAEFFEAGAIKHLSPQSTEDGTLLRRLGGMGLPFNALYVDGKAVAIKNGIIKETEALSLYAQCVNTAVANKL